MSAQDVPPRRPAGLTARHLGFTPAKPVSWLSPPLLVATAVRVLGAQFFGAYLDKRELQGVLPSKIYDHAGEQPDNGDFWLDYVGDLGDGFDATYSIAWLLARPELTVEEAGSGGRAQTLPRGQVLVLGGDQVYPTPSAEAYETRFRGPYRCALPVPPENPPALYALPGNHDWYDGLTAFLRVFAKDGWIGGWRTQQARSYFALQLPHRWWLFAVDTQGSAYIDHPQLAYFEDVARRLGPGDRILVCLPQPSWLKQAETPDAYDTVDFFLRRVIEPTGAECSMLLTGDLHHYARYERLSREPTGAQPDGAGPSRNEPAQTATTQNAPPLNEPPRAAHAHGAEAGISPAQLITCGGGGAYLSSTGSLPDEIQVPAPEPPTRSTGPSRRYRLARRYPSERRSNRYAWGVFGRLPLRNPGFGAVIGLVHTVLMLAFLTSQNRLLTATSVGTSAFVLVCTVALARDGRVVNRVMGVLHGAAHIALGMLGTLVWARLPFHDWPTVLHVGAAVVVYGPVLAVVGIQLVAAYLLIAGRFSVNSNELFAAQGIANSKCFLRIRIDRNGGLTVYPVAVDRVCRKWQAVPDGPDDAPWIAPSRQLAPRLIEAPIKLKAPVGEPPADETLRSVG